MEATGAATARHDAHYAPECVICGTALAGFLGHLFRVFGISRSSRNPNLCNRCNTHAVEGRVVELTVLFADLSSFTELTHDLGPERTHEVVHAFLQMATSALVKYDAFIDKYVGDAVMAFFNVPIRRSDHGAGAVAAAIEIQAGMAELSERFGLALQTAIGIASGWARVGRLGSTDGKDYTAIGDVVNLAARLEGQARAGEIVVDRTVQQATSDQLPDVPAESLQLKGFREPVEAYRLRSAGGTLPVTDQTAEPQRERALRLGTVIFSILGAPCAAATLIGPLAVGLGITGLFGAGGLLWAFELPEVRRPLFILVTLAALANLYTVWHARRLRQEAAARGELLPMTRLERRQTIVVVLSSLAILVVVALDLYTKARMMGGLTF